MGAREVGWGAAVERALEEAQPGDLVMLLGKGHEDFQLVGEARIPFGEREVVEGWFEGRGPGVA